MTNQQSARSTRRDTARHQDHAITRSRSSGIVHFTDGVERSAPLLHELTMQHRLKRDADGRPLHLGPVVTNAYQAAKLLGPLLAFEAAEVFGVLCLTARSRVIGLARQAGEGATVLDSHTARADARTATAGGGGGTARPGRWLTSSRAGTCHGHRDRLFVIEPAGA